MVPKVPLAKLEDITQLRALQVDHTVNELPSNIHTFLLNITPRVNHSFDEWSSYVQRRGLSMNPAVDYKLPIYVPTIPLAELKDITQPKAFQVDHTVGEMPIDVPAFPLAVPEDITHNFSRKYIPCYSQKWSGCSN